MPRQDKQQKDRDERDEDKRDDDERDEDESDESEDDEDEDERDKAKAKARKADASDDDDEDGEPDQAAQRVAKALGVAEEEKGEAAKEGAEGEEAEDKPEAEAAKPNRAARRREEALARRKKRAGALSASDDDEDDALLSKDKNARAKELLKRRREQAAAAARAPASNQLDAGEMVDDALARTTAAIGKWFKGNVQVIQWVIVIGLLGAGGYVLYNMRVEKKAGEASGKLLAAIAADRGIVLEEDKRSEDEKEYDTRKVFKSTTERADAALGAYGNVVEQHGGSGAALLAKLGQGGAHLEKKEFDKAIASYAEVLGSPLAAADPDVKGRAIEGTAFAKEGKGDLDGALASFKELGSIDLKGYKELSTYHEARVLFAKGDKAKAKELLEPLNTKLQTPTTEPQPVSYLKSAVLDLMTQIDPGSNNAAANKPPPGAKMPTPEELQDMARRAQEALQKKAPPPEPASSAAP